MAALCWLRDADAPPQTADVRWAMVGFAVGKRKPEGDFLSFLPSLPPSLPPPPFPSPSLLPRWIRNKAIGIGKEMGRNR